MTNELIRTIRHGERKLIWADEQPVQEPKLSKFILWIGGVDDHYETEEEAETAKQEWIDKGYHNGYDLCIERIDAQPEQTVKTTPSASETLDRIHGLLSGHEWDSDTTAEIADTLVSAGYEILEYEPTHDYA